MRQRNFLATGSIEECRKELMEVLEEWLLLKIRDKDPIPQGKGMEIRVKEVTVSSRG